MARIARQGTTRVVLPETAAERALLAFGEARGGTLVLNEGLYVAATDRLLLPEGVSAPAAQRLRRAFEEAALAHQRAERERRRFRLL